MKLSGHQLWSRAVRWASSGASLGAVERWREYSRFHGAWAPGVRLMRDLSLRGKTLVIVSCLMVPLVWLAGLAVARLYQEGAQAAQASSGMHHHQALRPLVLGTRGLLQATVRQGLGLPHEDLAALVKTQDERLRAFTQTLARAGSPALDGSVAHLHTRHQALVALASPAVPAVPAASASTEAPDAAPAAGKPVLDTPRDLVLHDYLDELDLVREQLFEEARLASHDDLALRALFKSGVELQPRLTRLLERLAGQGAGLLTLDDEFRGERLQRLTAAAVESELVLTMLRHELQRSVALGQIDKQLLDTRFDAIQQRLRLSRRLASLVRTQPAAELSATLGLDAPAYLRDMNEAVQASMAIESASLEALQRVLAREQRQVVWDVVWALAVPLLFFALLLYVILSAYKVLQGGLLAVTRNVEELAKGNLGIRPRPLGTDESGRTLVALSISAERMSRLFEAVTQGVGAVSQASREVAVGNGGLTERTVEIREAIGHVASKALTFSSMMDDCGSELSNTVDHVRAMQVDAARSRKAMGGLRERMRALTGKSREISHVVQIMEAVAFQTKLLALNASVEAARAGAAGKGFAVVAQEVRSLAVRSEESARRIHDILSSSISEIEECNLMTERASDAVRSTDEKIQAVNQSMGDIVRQTQTGMSESQEVVRITKQVAESISGNARLVEQLSDASLALREQGEALRRSVHHFLAH